MPQNKTIRDNCSYQECIAYSELFEERPSFLSEEKLVLEITLPFQVVPKLYIGNICCYVQENKAWIFSFEFLQKKRLPLKPVQTICSEEAHYTKFAQKSFKLSPAKPDTHQVRQIAGLLCAGQFDDVISISLNMDKDQKEISFFGSIQHLFKLYPFIFRGEVISLTQLLNKIEKFVLLRGSARGDNGYDFDISLDGIVVDKLLTGLATDKINSVGLGVMQDKVMQTMHTIQLELCERLRFETGLNWVLLGGDALPHEFLYKQKELLENAGFVVSEYATAKRLESMMPLASLLALK